MSCYGLLALRHLSAVVVFVLVCSFGVCDAAPTVEQLNAGASTSSNVSVVRETNTSPPTSPTESEECSLLKSSCKNCSRALKCAWCFSEKKCLPVELRDQRNACEEDDWYYGDCDKPDKEEVLVYVLLSCALFLLLIVILLVLYIFFCKMPRNKDYEPVSTKDKKKKRRRTPLMSKKAKPSGSRTDELKKKYQLDG